MALFAARQLTINQATDSARCATISSFTTQCAILRALLSCDVLFLFFPVAFRNLPFAAS